MRYYPAFLDLKARTCLVVGGGHVAERKVETLLDSGARVTVVSPKLTTGLKKLASIGAITHIHRGYRPGDLEGAALVVSAADTKAVNARVATDAEAGGILVNTVDDPERCSFVAPSVVERGGLLIAVSTSGEAPALARRVRVELEEAYGAEYAIVVDIMGALRRRFLRSGKARAEKDRALAELAASPLAELIRRGDRTSINRLLKDAAGPGVTLSKLGIRLQAGPGALSKTTKRKETKNR